MLLVLSVLTILIAIATLLPVSRITHWTVRWLDFPRVQIGTLAAFLLPLHVLLLELDAPVTWFLIVATTVCALWQLGWILPYTVLWPRKEVRDTLETEPARTLCILTCNVLTPNRNADALLRLVREHRPDIVVTMESDLWWEGKLDVLGFEMPHTIKCPLDNLYGMHVYSRLPLVDAETSFLVEKDVPSMHALVRLPSGDDVRVHFVHPAPPSPSENPESAERDAELVIVGRSVAASTLPVIVAGDLNDVAWSSTTRLFRKISGLLDPRIGRGMFNTFHAAYPLLRWPLDHLFHSDHFALKSIRRLPSIDSDHFPLLACLTLKPRHSEITQRFRPDEMDRKWADEIVDERDVSKDDVPSPGSRSRSTW